MDNKLSELKEALEFLEKTPFGGEWDNSLVGGENGQNYHAVTNSDDVVVRTADDSRHTSWLCDYLAAVSPVNIRALLAELERKNKYWNSAEDELERAKQRIASQDNHINQQQDRIESLEKKNSDIGKALGTAEKRLDTPIRVPSQAMFDEDDSAETVISVTRARLRAQGFEVYTDGATTVGDE